MTEPIRRLYRSRHDATLAGICAGLGNYLNADPVFLRVIVIAATFITGIVPGILTYLAVWLIVPLEPQPLPASPPQPAPQSNTV